MLISVKHNFVFICNTKCASNSCEEMLKPYSDLQLIHPRLRHSLYRQYEQCIKPLIKEQFDVENLETICVFREPVSWLYSWYRFRTRVELKNPSHPNHCRSTAGISFNEFLESYLSPNPKPYAEFGNQSKVIRDATGEVKVDKLFPYERLDLLTEYMSAKVGAPLTLKAINVSPRTGHDNFGTDLLRKARTRFLKKSSSLFVPEAKQSIEVPEALLKALHAAIPEDFEVYNSLLKHSVTSLIHTS